MSEEHKHPEMAGGRCAPAEDLPVPTEPGVIKVEVPGEVVKGAQVAEPSPAPTGVSVPR